MEASSSHFDCPKCGATNSLPAAERFPACEFCDATLYLDRSGLVGHYRLPRLVDRKQAGAALRRWMAGNRTVKDLDRKSRVEALQPVSFPMWLFRIRRGGTETVIVEPAAPTPIPQLADLNVPAGRLEPVTDAATDAEAVTVSVPAATAREWVAQRGFTEIDETALVEVPLWQAKYTYEGASYRALVEGSTGSVLASVFPEKAESPYVVVAVLGLLLFGVEGLLITNPILKLVVYAVTAVPVTLLAYWVTRKV